jgi:hypothetical protein
MKLLKINSNLSTAFHPQTDGQTEQVNQILETYLRIYCDYSQDNWVDLLSLAEFAYNNSQHSTTKFSPFFANKGYNPIAVPEDSILVKSNSLAASKNYQEIQEIHQQLKLNIAKANKHYSKHYNKNHLPDPDFKINSKVWLLAKNIKTTHPNKKLDYIKLGPFQILKKIGHCSYKLKFPSRIKRHPVYHVIYLEKYNENIIQNRVQEPSLPIIIDNEEEYEVNKILDSRINLNKLEYLVDWNGYSINDRSWESVSNLRNTSELINEFHSKYPKKPKSSQCSP